MIINRTVLAETFMGLKTLFDQAFSAVEPQWKKFAMLVPSTTRSNDYRWLDGFPKMRKWVGEKHVKAFTAQGYSITNDDWEATVAVERKDIEDDELGIYRVRTEMAGQSAAQLPDEIVADLVNGAFTQTCFDGQYFCDTDHLVAGASVSNKLTVALSAATQAGAIASLGAALAAMRTFKDEEGRPLGCTPTLLLVPPALADVANILVTNPTLDDGKPNPYRGTLEVVVFARATSSTAWFVLDTTKAVKPFIYQERKKPVFVSQTDPEASDVFNRAVYKYGAEARAAGGYGFWQLCVGSTG